MAAIFITSSPSKLTLFLICLGVGISYAGMVNIMLNGLGVVLSPHDNQGYLPGMNSGAFNLGAGLSFAILTAIQTALTTSSGKPTYGFQGAIVAGVILVGCALLMSLLIPSVESAKRDD